MKECCTIGLGSHKPFSNGGTIVDHALRIRCRVIDTAPNYGNGINQEIVGRAIGRMLSGELVISTKVGFVPSSMSVNDLSTLGVKPNDIAGRHCISPSYIRYQVKRNREILAGRAIDVLFIHNPEVQFGFRSKARALRALHDALEVCEELCISGDILCYGISTWAGLLDEESLSEIVARVATSFGPRHHFSSLQLPVSMVKFEHIAQAWFENRGPLIEAKDLGITVFASSPLHGGELVGIINSSLNRFFDRLLTPAQVAINFVRSSKLVDVVLVGTNSNEHLDEVFSVQNLSLFPLDLMERALKMLA